MKVMDLYRFVMDALHGEPKFKLKSEGKLWNPIFNSFMETVDCCIREKGVSKYKCTKELLLDNLEMKKNMYCREV